MNSIQLEYFLNVAKCGSFTVAAKKLFISQPALSKQVRLLEEELGTLLFIRLPNGVNLTPEGKKLLEQSEDIIRRIKNIPSILNDLHHTVSGELNIVCGSFLSRKLMPDLLKRLLALYPGICPRIREMRTTLQPGLLLNGSADIGIGSTFQNEKRLSCHPIFQSDFVLIRSSRSKTAAGKRFSKRELSALPLITYPKGTILYEAVKKTLHPYPLNVFMDSQSSETIIELVKENFGIAFVPDYLIEPEKRSGILIGGFDSDVKLTVSYHYFPERPLTPQAKAFIAVIHEKFGIET